MCMRVNVCVCVRVCVCASVCARIIVCVRVVRRVRCRMSPCVSDTTLCLLPRTTAAVCRPRWSSCVDTAVCVQVDGRIETVATRTRELGMVR